MLAVAPVRTVPLAAEPSRSRETLNDLNALAAKDDIEALV
jgi:hypothetical protein